MKQHFINLNTSNFISPLLLTTALNTTYAPLKFETTCTETTTHLGVRYRILTSYNRYILHSTFRFKDKKVFHQRDLDPLSLLYLLKRTTYPDCLGSTTKNTIKTYYTHQPNNDRHHLMNNGTPTPLTYEQIINSLKSQKRSLESRHGEPRTCNACS